MSDDYKEDSNKENDDIEDNTEDEVKDEEFVDANDHFVEEVNVVKEKLIDNESKKIKSETGSWFGIKSAISRLSGQKAEEGNQIKQMIISIKDETQRELKDREQKEELKTGAGTADKSTKIQIITDLKTTETETKRLEVTVINEDHIQIDSDDIEMSPCDSIKFLIDLIAALILDLFVISGVSHWIYNHLGGLDWYLEDTTKFNFHIFFMTLGICGFGFGILVHRIFRGWSSGALSFLHTTVTLMTLIFFVIGIYAVVVSLNHLDSIHFYSVHSWLGLLSMVSFTILWISGIVIFVFPRFIYDIQRLLIPIHSFFGRIVFTLVCGTAVVGFSDKLRMTDENVVIGPIYPIGRSFANNTVDDHLEYDSDYELTTQYQRNVDKNWQMPEEALLLNIISFAIFLYAIFVNYLSSNDVFKRRLLPEEQGINIKTRIIAT